MTDAQLALLVSAASATVAVMAFVWTISWSIWQYRHLHRPRLTVIVVSALPVGPGVTGDWCVSVTVVNDGGVAVTLTTIKFAVRKDRTRRGMFITRWAQEGPEPLPLKLAPGDRWTGLTEKRPLRDTLRQHFGARAEYALWVIAIDAANREYRTKVTISGS